MSRRKSFRLLSCSVSLAFWLRMFGFWGCDCDTLLLFRSLLFSLFVWLISIDAINILFPFGFDKCAILHHKGKSHNYPIIALLMVTEWFLCNSKEGQRTQWSHYCHVHHYSWSLCDLPWFRILTLMKTYVSFFLPLLQNPNLSVLIFNPSATRRAH